MKRKISLYIKDILENMNKAVEFAGDINLEEFKNDEKTSYAIVRCIEIIGEATKQVPSEVRDKYPEIPWRDMAGMRDKLIHFYFGLDVKKIWLVIIEDIPQIRPLLANVLNEMEKQGL